MLPVCRRAVLRTVCLAGAGRLFACAAALSASRRSRPARAHRRVCRRRSPRPNAPPCPSSTTPWRCRLLARALRPAVDRRSSWTRWSTAARSRRRLSWSATAPALRSTACSSHTRRRGRRPRLTLAPSRASAHAGPLDIAEACASILFRFSSRPARVALRQSHQSACTQARRTPGGEPVWALLRAEADCAREKDS